MANASTGLCVWVICKHPRDFPHHFTLRPQYASADGIRVARCCGLYNSIDEARFDLPEGLYPIGRDPGDDPVIWEVWI